MEVKINTSLGALTVRREPDTQIINCSLRTPWGSPEQVDFEIADSEWNKLFPLVQPVGGEPAGEVVDSTCEEIACTCPMSVREAMDEVQDVGGPHHSRGCPLYHPEAGKRYADPAEAALWDRELS